MRPAPSGRQPYRSRRGNGYAPAGAPKGFPLTLWKPSDAKVGKKPMGRQIPLHRRSRRANPPLSPLLPSFLQRLYQPKMLPVELQ